NEEESEEEYYSESEEEKTEESDNEEVITTNNLHKTIQKKFEEEVFPQAELSNRKDDNQLEEMLKMKEKVTDVTHRKAHKSRREYIFNFLNEISNKNNASIFALREAINDMLKEYKRNTNLAITITRANNAQNEEARKAIQNKYRDLLATQLETKGQMIIEENIETQLSKNQSQIQTKLPPPRLELSKTGYQEEHQYPGSPRSPPKSPIEFDKSSINRSSKQHTHSSKTLSSLRNSVDLTNTPDIVLPTPTPIQNNQQTRNLKQPIDRNNTLLPASWYKNQKINNQEQEVYNKENQQIPIIYNYSITPNLLPSRFPRPSAYTKFKESIKNEIQQRNEGIRALTDESDDESLTKEQQEFLKEMDKEIQEHIKNNNLHIQLNHIHPIKRKKIIPIVLVDAKKDDQIYSAQNIVLP
ncbi:9405_t:CDS:2, partial [Dentiscutata heterogama]